MPLMISAIIPAVFTNGLRRHASRQRFPTSLLACLPMGPKCMTHRLLPFGDSSVIRVCGVICGVLWREDSLRTTCARKPSRAASARSRRICAGKSQQGGRPPTRGPDHAIIISLTRTPLKRHQQDANGPKHGEAQHAPLYIALAVVRLIDSQTLRNLPFVGAGSGPLA
jgi:hypothetical protein